MENVTTNVKIVGELPFQRFVNFFLWNIDEKAEYDFNVVEEKYDPSTHKDVSFESGKETDTLKTVSGFVKFTYKGEAGSVSYNYRNHLKFDKKDLFDNAINGTYRLNIFSTTDLTTEYSSISIMVMEKLAMFLQKTSDTLRDILTCEMMTKLGIKKLMLKNLSKKLKIHILSLLMAKRYFSVIIGVKSKICYTIS